MDARDKALLAVISCRWRDWRYWPSFTSLALLAVVRVIGVINVVGVIGLINVVGVIGLFRFRSCYVNQCPGSVSCTRTRFLDLPQQKGSKTLYLSDYLNVS